MNRGFGLEHLLQNKRVVGRPRVLADVAEVKARRRPSGGTEEG